MRECDDCGARFAEGRAALDYRGECHGSPAYERLECCPVCGAPEHHALAACQGCGGWYSPLELVEEYCPGCGQEIQARFGRQAYDWARGLSPQERAYLREALLEEEALEALRRQLAGT